MSKYTDDLSAEDLIHHIAFDYVEMSHDKVAHAYRDHMRICRSWLEKHLPKKHKLNPAAARARALLDDYISPAEIPDSTCPIRPIPSNPWFIKLRQTLERQAMLEDRLGLLDENGELVDLLVTKPSLSPKKRKAASRPKDAGSVGYVDHGFRSQDDFG